MLAILPVVTEAKGNKSRRAQPSCTRSAAPVGSYTIIIGDYNETDSCEYWNAAGDKIFSIYARKGDPTKAEGAWHVVHGTGKFAGISMEGKWMPIGAFPPVPNVASACSHEWGPYNIK